jgi:hypothetical protein
MDGKNVNLLCSDKEQYSCPACQLNRWYLEELSRTGYTLDTIEEYKRRGLQVSGHTYDHTCRLSHERMKNEKVL